ncbi:ferritin-like domain-containing protein [Companilactobacillus mishanensis]|uniref:DNA starvation/stationary phase protection protein n=1 Tax=Companilactobacillus mishanensis TaxID=2486008 RepID=A0ABW9P5Z0_9LACO|nr:ferritin-like domain-containing protein [Companilactobacillus mishanensis]MQS44645.1 DNA starvation/stationary phase protection protein [Companilactobacillus mishanensis]
MTEQATIESKFAAEQKQADADHHKPTAGAMTNHVLSNHAILNTKLHQIQWFVKGPNAENYKAVLSQVIYENYEWFDKIAEQLLDEGEIPSSTTDEYKEYTMLEEHGENKYLDADEMLETIVQDLVTDNMFVTRAIKLAEKEDRPAFQELLVEMYGWNNHQIRVFQGLLGKTATEGLEDDDDDDE